MSDSSDSFTGQESDDEEDDICNKPSKDDDDSVKSNVHLCYSSSWISGTLMITGGAWFKS